jgi:osmotically-inducible protein OsmY
MQQRGRQELRRNEPRSGQRGSPQYDEYTEGGGRSMTPQTSEGQQEDWSGRESGGGWTGYVVPYRYYGPGYRGVGYYSVMYQGDGGEEGQREGQYDERGTRHGQRSGWDDRADLIARSQSSGGFAGRGPKGYQRSDERLREEVSDRLMADDQVDASDIEVEVRDGEVRLTGTVPDRWAKRRAEDCAEQVMGVRDVMNQIRVQGSPAERGGPATGSSGTTSRAASRGDSSLSQSAGNQTSRSGGSESSGAKNGSRRGTASSRR